METNFFYKTKHQTEIQNKKSKGTPVYGNELFLQNKTSKGNTKQKIERTTCMETNCCFAHHKNQKGHMHGNELFVLSAKQNKNQAKSKGNLVYGNELCAWSSVFLFLIAELKPSRDTSAVTIY